MVTFPTVRYNPDWTQERNAGYLEKVMRDERKAHALRGYWFTFNTEERSSYDRACPALSQDCDDMMRAARYDRQYVRLFRNYNGQIAAELVNN